MSMIGRLMPITRSVWYSCEEDASDARYELRTIHGLRDDDQRDEVAEEAATDYHNQHDGARDHWPRTFVLFDSKDGPEVARYHVEREFDPSFLAVELPRAVDAVGERRE